MKIFALVVLAVTSSALLLITPDGELKRYVKYIISLVFAVALLTPLASLLMRLPDYVTGIEFDPPQSSTDILPDANALVVSYTASKLSAEIESALHRELGVECDVMVEFNASDLENVTVESVNVLLLDATAGDTVARYVRSMLGGFVDVQIVGGENYG